MISRLLAVDTVERVDLLLFLTECADHADTVEVFPGGSRHVIQSALYLLVQRNATQHDGEYNDGQNRNGDHEDQSNVAIYRKGHDGGTEHDDRGAQKQAQDHVDPRLNLIDVAGHAGHQGGGSDLVGLGVGEGLNMYEQIVSQLGGTAYGRLGRKILRGHRAGQSHHGQQHQHGCHAEYEQLVAAPVDAAVNDGGHHQRNQQVKAGLQQLEQRRGDAFPGVLLEKTEKHFHDCVYSHTDGRGRLTTDIFCLPLYNKASEYARAFENFIVQRLFTNFWVKTAKKWIFRFLGLLAVKRICAFVSMDFQVGFLEKKPLLPVLCNMYKWQVKILGN